MKEKHIEKGGERKREAKIKRVYTGGSFEFVGI